MSVSKCTSFQHCSTSRKDICNVAPKVGMVIGAILVALGPLLFCYGIGRFPIMATITAGGAALTLACALIKLCNRASKPKETATQSVTQIAKEEVSSTKTEGASSAAAQAVNPLRKSKIVRGDFFHVAQDRPLGALKLFMKAQDDTNYLTETDENGKTLLHYAAMSKEEPKDTMYPDRKILALLEAGAHINTADKDGFTPLHDAASFEAANALLAKKANIEAVAKDGSTPLLRAVDKDRIQVIQLLINAKANIQATNRARQNMLHLAALTGNAKLLMTLTNVAKAGMSGGDFFKFLNADDKYECTPLLHFALSVKTSAHLEEFLNTYRDATKENVKEMLETRLKRLQAETTCDTIQAEITEVQKMIVFVSKPQTL